MTIDADKLIARIRELIADEEKAATGRHCPKAYSRGRIDAMAEVLSELTPPMAEAEARRLFVNGVTAHMREGG